MSLPNCCESCWDFLPDWKGNVCEYREDCPKYKDYIKNHMDDTVNDLSDDDIFKS